MHEVLQGVVKTTSNEDEENPTRKTLTEAAEATFSGKRDGSTYRDIQCVVQKCDKCYLDNLKLLPEETITEGSVRSLQYDYIPTGKYLVNGQEKKKIALVPKETALFTAKWRRDQLDNLLQHLPLGHVMCIHDYSEKNACRKQDEIQLRAF